MFQEFSTTAGFQDMDCLTERRPVYGGERNALIEVHGIRPVPTVHPCRIIPEQGTVLARVGSVRICHLHSTGRAVLGWGWNFLDSHSPPCAGAAGGGTRVEIYHPTQPGRVAEEYRVVSNRPGWNGVVESVEFVCISHSITMSARRFRTFDADAAPGG